MATQETADTKYITAGNGVKFAYRVLGHHDKTSILPLFMHIHFRANMDFWDPLLVNNIAYHRPVVIFDQAGIGKSSGNVATTYQGWADNVIYLIEALKFVKIDLFGFSMGGWNVQMVALTRPDLIRKLIIAGSGPSMLSHQVPGIVWPRETAPEEPIKMLATARAESREEVEASITVSFFPPTNAGRLAAQQYFARIRSRAAPETAIFSLLDAEKSAEQRKAAQHWYNAANTGNSFHRLGELSMPVLIINGDDDLLIPTGHSWELLKGIRNAQLIIYPQSGHGFLWQYAERVARDFNVFLDDDLDKVAARL
ncbi:2-hydroxy-6-oxo-6-phenylhexa-2,4-dienoate hydrolase [Pseudocercospora fuligena]|uniref:2-hydroxy-6-oxo-6-phenylhexa-2,4-dienoate hydrolase n=1 Tax=Pseudocercospora fuligena TaxID=685502 RepID=A0A8H6RJQ0_9PEZI|nr:2-hydroxy-6-oxo-6-phenylhexa-2,4-dienoate hydrolase [Pseudocercospora fuligena]